ncbi:MAG: AtpZ/AtpI family protein [Deltaproteobacteria bacterium]|nr:AtpZ/AtpI family protein [Deltaproteobacteria bacterium]
MQPSKPQKSGRKVNKPDDQDSIYFTLGLYGACGFQLAIAVVGGLLLGSWIDKKFTLPPIFALLGLTLGFVAGLWNLIRILNWQKSRK